MTNSHATNLPLVTVVIPTYNRAHLVTEAIESALGQTYPNLEIIVVNDGSSDETERVVTEGYGDRVTYVRQENRGLAGARNTGIRAGHGDYFAFHDDDDLWVSSKLEKQLAQLQAHPECALAYCACLEADTEGRSTGRLYLHSGKGRTGDNLGLLLKRTGILPSSVVVPKWCLERIGLFDEQLRVCEDTDFFLRVYLRHPAAYLREPLVLMRTHGEQKSRTDPKLRNFQAHAHIMSKALEILPPERERFRPLLVRELIWAKLRGLQMRAEGLAWADLAGELIEIIRSAQDLRYLHRICGWVADLVAAWSRAQNPPALPSGEQVTCLARAIAAEAGGRGHSRQAWQAGVYAALAMSWLGRGTLGRAAGAGARAKLTHLPVALAHFAWEVIRAARGRQGGLARPRLSRQ